VGSDSHVAADIGGITDGQVYVTFASIGRALLMPERRRFVLQVNVRAPISR
jgi:hypothetical protein